MTSDPNDVIQLRGMAQGPVEAMPRRQETNRVRRETPITTATLNQFMREFRAVTRGKTSTEPIYETNRRTPDKPTWRNWKC